MWATAGGVGWTGPGLVFVAADTAVVPQARQASAAVRPMIGRTSGPIEYLCL